MKSQTFQIRDHPGQFWFLINLQKIDERYTGFWPVWYSFLLPTYSNQPNWQKIVLYPQDYALSYQVVGILVCSSTFQNTFIEQAQKCLNMFSIFLGKLTSIVQNHYDSIQKVDNMKLKNGLERSVLSQRTYAVVYKHLALLYYSI